MEVQGKIKVISDAETFGTFTKRSWVITTEDQYPQMIQLECHQDKTGLLDKFKVGDDVKASINLRGKEWINPEGVAKYFNTIVSWRIEKAEAITPPLNDAPVSNDPTPDEDLPF